VLDRFSIYKKLISNLNDVENNKLKANLLIMISPLYLAAIKYVENNLERNFKDLTLKQKIIIFPSKLSAKVKNLKLRITQNSALTISNENSSKGKIIFFPVEPTHLRQMIPVSNQLNPNDYYYITDRINLYKDLEKKLIPVRFISQINDCKNSNFDFTPLGNGIIPENLNTIWNSYCLYLIETKLPSLSKTISNALNIIQPRKLVIGYDITPEGRFCVHLAKKMNIPTICIQHGSIAGEPLDGEHIVDSYLLYGKKAMDYLIKIGNEKSKLKVFGAPYLDELNFDKSQRVDLLNSLSLKAQNKTILIALSGPGHCTSVGHFDQIVSSIVKLAKNNSKINFIFKLHRKDNKLNYEKIFTEIGFSCPVIEAVNTNFSNDIFFWLNAVDVLITGSSTVALEAMLKNIPVITVDYKNEYRNIDFIEEGCTYHVIEEAELETNLLNALDSIGNTEDNPIRLAAKNYINEYFFTAANSTSSRIASWLINN
jgi:hypothetical protein